MSETITERLARRQEFNRLAAEDLVLVQNLTIEMMALKSGNPLTADQVRLRLFLASDVFGISEWPRGYRVLGGTAKTPHYLQMQDASKPTDGQIVADALSGWLLEIAAVLEKRLADARKNAPPPSADRAVLVAK